ncbi:SDR family NAD(P)-dependent oxidoreductase [Marinospirillum sp. MEB164]|uniref:SDR family NAD(P)-dependent oxidoreductase n=1 Tax=Marinospirillum alkalitolerans TaxID=3123374 RepID=A0ABW8PXD0_9GAMM
MHLIIAGAGSGIGLALVESCLAEKHWTQISALYRRSGTALMALAEQDPRLVCYQLDLADDQQVAAWAQQSRHPVDWLINTSGILHDQAQDLQPEKSLQQLKRQSLMTSLTHNALNHLLLLQQLQPYFNKQRPVVIASLSARVGSIGDNRLGGWYAYRASKAALNQLMHTAAIELRRTHPGSLCVTLHPGTTDTPLSAPFQARVPAAQLFDARQSAAYLLQVLRGLTPEQTGGFFAWDGQPIPW